MDWKSNFDERELKEIEFCVLYAKQFGHGTVGHNIRVIVSKMVSILCNAESVINKEPESPFIPWPEGEPTGIDSIDCNNVGPSLGLDGKPE